MYEFVVSMMVVVVQVLRVLLNVEASTVAAAAAADRSDMNVAGFR